MEDSLRMRYSGRVTRVDSIVEDVVVSRCGIRA